MWFNQRLEVGRSGSIDRLVCQYHDLESNASDYREPVEVPEEVDRPPILNLKFGLKFIVRSLLYS